MPINRNQALFVFRFLGLLIAFYVVTLIPAADRALIAPATRALARVSAAVLNVLGENVVLHGTVIAGATFAVDIRNGCNGIETMVFLGAAILAFPASPRARLIGVLGSGGAVQLLNVIRIVTLYLLGRYHRSLFDAFHLAVWQTVVFGAGVLLFVAWTSKARVAAAS